VDRIAKWHGARHISAVASFSTPLAIIILRAGGTNKLRRTFRFCPSYLHSLGDSISFVEWIGCAILSGFASRCAGVTTGGDFGARVS